MSARAGWGTGHAQNDADNIEGSTMERFSMANIARRRSSARRNPLHGNVAPMHASGAGVSASALAVAALVFSPSAQASFLPPEMMDSAAMYLAWFVIIFVPIGAIVLFWLVHILPEKIAHKRHHPQRDAIQVLCLLSLVFGGLLWPIAWLWAYVKPVGYKMAYGTEKHEDYYDEMAEKHRAGKLVREDLYHLREDLEAMEARGALPPKLKALKDELVLLRREDAESAAAAVERTPPPATNEKGQA